MACQPLMLLPSRQHCFSTTLPVLEKRPAVARTLRLLLFPWQARPAADLFQGNMKATPSTSLNPL